MKAVKRAHFEEIVEFATELNAGWSTADNDLMMDSEKRFLIRERRHTM